MTAFGSALAPALGTADTSTLAFWALGKEEVGLSRGLCPLLPSRPPQYGHTAPGLEASPVV